ncbi:MAG: hypothetical protein ACRDGN_05155 [bacterium]
MPLAVANVVVATIPNAQAVSDIVPIGTRGILGILMPAAWTAAAITFSAGVDGAAVSDVTDAAGAEIAIASAGAVAGKFVLAPASIAALRGFVRVRSGTGAAPVNQGAQRLLTLVLG